MTHEAIERFVVDVRSEPAFHPDDVADKMDEPVMPPARSAQNTPLRPILGMKDVRCGPWLPDLKQVNHEDQRLARLDDTAGATIAVGEVGGNEQLPATADLHTLHALVPALDDLADAQSERQRLTAVVGSVELLTGGVSDADIVHDHRVTGGSLSAVALDDVGDDQVGGRLSAGEIDLGLLCSHAHHIGRWSPVVVPTGGRNTAGSNGVRPTPRVRREAVRGPQRL